MVEIDDTLSTHYGKQAPRVEGMAGDGHAYIAGIIFVLISAALVFFLFHKRD
jgi:hypothetical protein